MAERTPTRLVEGPLCKTCMGGLTIVGERRESEGESIRYVHRDKGPEFEHLPVVTYRIIRE